MAVSSLWSRGQWSAALAWLRDNAPGAARTWTRHDLRWSYLVLAGLVAIGIAVNVLLPGGWTVWPVVAAATMLMYVHEAADRNGEGIPPLNVYALFAGAVAVWLSFSLVLTQINPVVLLLGVGVIVYYAIKGYLKQREVRRLIAERRAQGLCIHCGHPADPLQGVCLHCGEEPDPDAMQVQRVQAVVAKGASGSKMRAALRQESLAKSASRKEAALLRQRQQRRPSGK